MKFLLVFLGVNASIIGFSQTLDLTSETSIREFLNDKEIKVGEYGTIRFTYDKYNRDFGSIDFKILYQLTEKTIPLKANIFIHLDEFGFPKYVRSITLSYPNSNEFLNIGAPTFFQLFENGEIYYQDKTTMSMQDFINSITSGRAFVSTPIFKLCN